MIDDDEEVDDLEDDDIFDNKRGRGSFKNNNYQHAFVEMFAKNKPKPQAKLMGWFKRGYAWVIQRPCGDFVLCGGHDDILHIIHIWDKSYFREINHLNNYIMKTSKGEYCPLDRPIELEDITLRTLQQVQDKISRSRENRSLKDLSNKYFGSVPE